MTSRRNFQNLNHFTDFHETLCQKYAKFDLIGVEILGSPAEILRIFVEAMKSIFRIPHDSNLFYDFGLDSAGIRLF